MLVVADKKSPEDWSHENTIYLSIPTQLSLNYSVLAHLPFNSYTRKALGYLYALQHGAVIIYDTDDDNAPDDISRFEQDFIVTPTSRGLMPSPANSSVVSNPYAHFGQSSVWPRGYPLDLIGLPHNHSYTVCRLKTPWVQQGIVNGDPDVDAIYRLTRKSLDYPINIQFDSRAPPIIYPAGLLSPYNSQNTLFHYNAFWSLLFPTTVAFRVTDIWRGYWAQPLLWAVGGNLGFLPPHTTQLRNAHLYLRDFGEEDQMYKQAGEMAVFLNEWRCQAQDLYGCMTQLTREMGEKGYWGKREEALLEAWIFDLKRVGYKVPPLVKAPNPCLPDAVQSPVTFHGVQIPIQPNSNDTFLLPQQDKDRLVLRNLCDFPVNDPKSSAPIFTFPSTLLVITFNIPHFENIWLLDALYRPHFPNLLYCGEVKNWTQILELQKSPEFSETPAFSMISASVGSGYFVYDCVLRAVEMKYGVEQTIVMSDDILYNFWNNEKYSENEIWLLDKVRKFLSTEDVTSAKGWQWWNSGMGINVTRDALKEIYDDKSNALLQKWVEDRENFGYNQSWVPFSESDFLRFPQFVEDEVYEVLKVLREHKVFLEIAVPTMASGISDRDALVAMPGRGVWGGDRNKIFEKFYKEEESVYHPIKFGNMLKDGNQTEEYCENYVRRVLEH